MHKIVGSDIGDFWIGEEAPPPGEVSFHPDELETLLISMEIFEGSVVKIKQGEVVRFFGGYDDKTDMRMKVEAFIKGNQTSPLVECNDIDDQVPGRPFIVYGNVSNVRVKDHNDEDKVEKRGYKMRGFTEYVVITYGSSYVYFDKNFTRNHKDELLALKDSLALFVVTRNAEGFINGKRFAVIRQEEGV